VTSSEGRHKSQTILSCTSINDYLARGELLRRVKWPNPWTDSKGPGAGLLDRWQLPRAISLALLDASASLGQLELRLVPA
jgi:hypothetical protein